MGVPDFLPYSNQKARHLAVPWSWLFGALFSNCGRNQRISNGCSSAAKPVQNVANHFARATMYHR